MKTLDDYIREITALDATLTDGIRVSRDGRTCDCKYGTARDARIEDAYYTGLSANDYVVRSRYESARRRADRNA